MKDFISDKDYILKDKRAWLEVDGFSIRVAKINSGLTIKVFKNGEECSTPIDELLCLDDEGLYNFIDELETVEEDA